MKVILLTLILSLSIFSKEKPNILFIAIDDLNDWTGYLGGHPQAKTPNIDNLASRGTAFTKAFCAAPACGPSRAAIMTGIYPSTSGVYENKNDWRENELLSKSQTLPQYFRSHGYKAIGSGKIFHGIHPHPQSWDTYWPSLEQHKPRDLRPDEESLYELPSGLNWGPVHQPEEKFSDMQIAEWIGNQLKQKHDKPFFMACGFFRPHLPWFAPKKYFDMHPLDKIKLPTVRLDDLNDIPKPGKKMAKPDKHHATILKEGKWREGVQAYLAASSYADACVGKVMAALDEGPNKENTVIVLWSDHGWHLGSKQHWSKFALWEQATQSNLIFAGPGIKSGQRASSPVGLIDIYQSLVDLCGLPKKQGVDSVSLKPLIDDPELKASRPVLTTEFYKNHSLRTERWRYIRYADGSEELYDHQKDPLEWDNLAQNTEYKSIIKTLKKSLPKVNASKMPKEKK